MESIRGAKGEVAGFGAGPPLMDWTMLSPYRSIISSSSQGTMDLSRSFDTYGDAVPVARHALAESDRTL